jgi:hypothetical protein
MDLVRVHDWAENDEPIASATPSQKGGFMKQSDSQQLQSRVIFSRGNTTPKSDRNGRLSGNNGWGLEKSPLFNPKTTPRAWRRWDARKADAKFAEQFRSLEAARPKADQSAMVFEETWHPTTIDKNGERVRATSRPIKTTIPRFEPEALLEGVESMAMVIEAVQPEDNAQRRPATFKPIDPEEDLIII